MSFAISVSQIELQCDSFGRYVRIGKRGDRSQEFNMSNALARYRRKVRVIVIDYFSLSRKADAQCGRYTIPSLRLQILFRKSRLERTAGASNRDPMCKMAFPYVTYGHVYIVTERDVPFSLSTFFSLPSRSFSSVAGGTAILGH